MRLLGVSICLFVCLWSACCSSAPWPDRYDLQIRLAARHWLPGVDWRLYKAQLIQESQLNPAAVSPVGAKGLAQFMPGTWQQWQQKSGTHLSPHDPAQAIEAGAWYMGNLRLIWRSPRPEVDRHNLAMASYNAGAGNIIKAQRACGNPPGYEAIMACLPQITGRHAAETRGYAPRIRAIYVRLML
jgi:soluble lytic murein transglycosylase-like protein